MNAQLIVLFALLAVVIAQFAAMIALFARNRRQADMSQSSAEYSKSMEAALLEEFVKNRNAASDAAREDRKELASTLNSFRQESTAKIEALTAAITDRLDKIRDAVEKKLADLQTGNEKKLEEMRTTVDEKLNTTLQTRLGESFKLVSERLETVQKGLGEMQSLATDVGSIKNVLSNVKNKGVLGEYQLGAILEQILTQDQYEQNVRVKAGSRENVEFAVKIPGKDDTDKTVWLPIDAKFPTADYELLLEAYEKGDREMVVQAQKELKTKIEKFAKDINEKYIDPPNTTVVGVMFLPFEGLYAEVLRIPGLFANIQNTYKVIIAGPTTISAILNSLQMSFRSIAVAKRTSEIWNLLGEVKTQFGKFGDVLQKTRDKLESASREIGNAEVRTRAIERKLRDVQTLPGSKAPQLPDNTGAVYDEDDY